MKATRATLLDGRATRTHRAMVDGVGEVWVRHLSARDLLAIHERTVDIKDEVRLELHNAALAIVYGVCDATGARLFADDDLDAVLDQMSVEVLKGCAMAVLTANKLTTEENTKRKKG